MTILFVVASFQYYPRVARRPVRSPRISKIVTNKSSSEDDIESEGLTAEEDSWTTEGKLFIDVKAYKNLSKFTSLIQLSDHIWGP